MTKVELRLMCHQNLFHSKAHARREMIDPNCLMKAKLWQPLRSGRQSCRSHRNVILSVDDNAKIIDVLFKFAANEKIIGHRHTSDFNTFVIKENINCRLVVYY